ncbi:MAG: TIGR02757 family protein [Chlamydiae bacterium]|nr:MAG: TIGR02757 family protein [Chlamydiota bacterium]
MKNIKLKSLLDKLYLKYNRPEFISPDPLEFITPFKKVDDREIAGMIASSLAYGRVAQILKSVNYILEIMKPSPSEFVSKVSEKKLRELFANFKYRFNDGKDITDLILGIKKNREKYGSLENCLFAGLKPDDKNILSAMAGFVDELTNQKQSYLLPSPQKNSACKRLNLYLRWMVRKDNVDPGGWSKIPTSKLIIPLDTHMFKIGTILGFTKRKQANLKTAVEITAGFAKFVPEDPARYDFALTRFGIRDDMKMEEFKRLTVGTNPK